MNSATRSVAVVATRLPSIDRRALSQAWYSALHLAQPAGGGAAVRLAPLAAPPAPRPTAPPALAPAGRRGPATPAPAATRAQNARRAPIVAPNNERRAASGALARRIEHAVARWQRTANRPTTAIAIDAGNGRVRVYVRCDGGATRIVALCAPHLRERVDRALAQARFTLAGSGLALEVTP